MVHDFGSYFSDTVEKYCPTYGHFLHGLNTDLTYMFELVGPYNRVVIPYEESAIYFLGARNKYTGEEFNCSALTARALDMDGFELPKQYPLTSVSDCVKLAETFSWDQEGFVTCDANFRLSRLHMLWLTLHVIIM